MNARIHAFVLLLAISPCAAADDRPPLTPHTRCATWSLRETVGENAWTSAARAPGLQDGSIRGGPCGITPVGPPPNPQIGDSWNWYCWRLNGFPEADLKSCTVRGMGDHCYVVVEDSQWNLNVDQTKIDAIVDAFENASIGSFPTQGIWDLDTTHFGQPPDAIDLDPRVYIFYYDFDVNADGFFWAFDQECDDVAEFHSNECDAVYMNCSDFDPAGPYLLAVLAHEFQHLIHYNADQNEEAWVDEGMGELAMWLYGNPDNVVSFNNNPDRALTSFSGNFYDYVKTYLWCLYFYERYGGQPAVFSFVSKPQNGIAAFELVLDEFLYPENFVDVFADWVVANFLDDGSIGDGRFGYVGETLPAFNPFITISSYPVGPNSAAVAHFAADYARYLNGSGVHATFDGVDNTLFRVRALLLDDTAATQVLDMTLGAGQVGGLSLPQVGTTHDQVVMVYAGAATTGATTYTYGASSGIVGAPEVLAVSGLSLEARASVSASPTFAFAIPDDAGAGAVRLEVIDVLGRRVRTLVDAIGRIGRHEAIWDGRDDAGALAAPGSYFARLTAGGRDAITRVTLRR